jgi:hypothetical protein
MSQVLQKPYECYGCKQQIRISKIDNVQPGQKKQWLQFEMDGITPHNCKPQQQSQQQQQTRFEQRSELAAIQKELAANTALLKTLISQVQYLRKELGK